MAQANKPTLRDPNVLFLSFMGAGFSPIAPGTVGTIVTVPFLIFITWLDIPFLALSATVGCLTIISCYLAEKAQKKYDVHDPSWIVFDESIGISIAWLFLLQHSVIDILAIFCLFRFFDILKIWPASYFDGLNTGTGTILDDVVAGIFAGLIYLLFYYILSLF